MNISGAFAVSAANCPRTACAWTSSHGQLANARARRRRRAARQRPGRRHCGRCHRSPASTTCSRQSDPGLGRQRCHLHRQGRTVPPPADRPPGRGQVGSFIAAERQRGHRDDGGLMSATRAYQRTSRAINATKRVLQAALEIGRGADHRWRSTDFSDPRHPASVKPAPPRPSRLHGRDRRGGFANVLGLDLGSTSCGRGGPVDLRS